LSSKYLWHNYGYEGSLVSKGSVISDTFVYFHCHSHFLPATLDFTSLFTMAYFRATHFLQLSCLECRDAPGKLFGKIQGKLQNGANIQKMDAELLHFTVLCMAKTVLSFVFHSSLRTAKSVDSVVAPDGLLYITEKNFAPIFHTRCFDSTLSYQILCISYFFLPGLDRWAGLAYHPQD